MAYDDDKSDFEQRPDVPADQKVTSDEWDAMVQDQQNHSGRHEDGGTDEISVQGLAGVLADPQPPNEEQVEDIVNGLVEAGDKLSWTYDDGNDTLTINTTALDEEEVEDAVNALLTGGTQVTTTYDDANDTLTISIDAPTQAEFDDHSARHETGGADTIGHDNLTGFVSDEHIDHTAVTITAGAGLVGGGDISSSRTIDSHVVTTETSAYTASENDIVLADASAGAFAVTLPSPSADVVVSIKKIDSSSNSVAIDTPNTETIDGDSSRTLTSQYVSRTITSDGSNYYII